MADNTSLNAGSGGDTLRDFQDATGNKWPAAVVCYATTILSGANVLQPVTPSLGLPVAQQGTWTVIANAGTGTFAISAAALPLPTGASTAAKQPSLGTAGTAASDVITVQGIVGMTAFTVAQSGTWNLAAITSALPAGTNLLGQVSASPETGTVYNGTTALTPKFATITASASGATTIVAAVGGKRIRVLRWSLSANGGVNIKWQSHVTPTDLTGLRYLTQFASAGGAYCPAGIFQTVSGEALDLNLSAAVAVGGELTYIEV